MRLLGRYVPAEHQATGTENISASLLSILNVRSHLHDIFLVKWRVELTAALEH